MAKEYQWCSVLEKHGALADAIFIRLPNRKKLTEREVKAAIPATIMKIMEEEPQKYVCLTYGMTKKSVKMILEKAITKKEEILDFKIMLFTHFVKRIFTKGGTGRWKKIDCTTHHCKRGIFCDFNCSSQTKDMNILIEAAKRAYNTFLPEDMEENQVKIKSSVFWNDLYFTCMGGHDDSWSSHERDETVFELAETNTTSEEEVESPSSSDLPSDVPEKKIDSGIEMVADSDKLHLDSDSPSEIAESPSPSATIEPVDQTRDVSISEEHGHEERDLQKVNNLLKKENDDLHKKCAELENRLKILTAEKEGLTAALIATTR